MSERAKYSVFSAPVHQRHIQMWTNMLKFYHPRTIEEAVAMVRNSTPFGEGFAYIGDATDIRYLELTNCDLQMIGYEFGAAPYAIGLQQGSPLKEQLNRA